MTFPIKALDCVSHDIGIVKNLYALARHHTDPLYYNYALNSGDISYLYQRKVNYTLKAGGCGQTQEDAFLGLLGEALERYASGFFNPNEKIVSSYHNLKHKAIHPKDMALFHPQQFTNPDFTLTPFDDNTETSWFPMIDLYDSQEVYYPGQLIFMPYQEDPKPIASGSSTGLATHTNIYKAILSGLYEVIERDTFSIMWYQKMSLPKIKITPDIQHYISTFFPTLYEIHLFDMSLDWNVASIWGLCYGKNEFGEFVICAAACRYTHQEAIQKVIQELGQGIPYARMLHQEFKNSKVNSNYETLDNFNAHAALYVQDKNLRDKVLGHYRDQDATHYIDWNRKDNFNDQQKIKNIVAFCHHKNYSVLCKDVTTVDVEQVGFKAVRIAIPQAIPLSGSYQHYYLGGQRLYEVPESLGYPTYSFEQLNPYPHLFP